MALRNLRLNGDEILRKKCREVKEIDDKIRMILDDMLDTMYENEGVGLAGPQIGILKRLVVIDVDGENVYKMVNPKILSTSGSQIDDEGCLSVPKKRGNVDRPQFVTVAYADEYGNARTLKGEGFLARCICHELDHLEGVLFIDKVIEEQVD